MNFYSIFRKGNGSFFLTMTLLMLYSVTALAGGISLSGSRIIYPANEKQVSFSVSNTNDTTTYLIQSWVETPDGKKTLDLVVTPPIYQSGPKSENVLRIIAAGRVFPQDRESLYYFNTKAIPGINRTGSETHSSLVIATETQLKLFVRPDKLSPSRDDALKRLRFSPKNSAVEVSNPTPYYFTLTDISLGSHSVKDVMIAPFGHADIALTGRVGETVSYNSINDYGGVDKSESAIE